MICQTVNGQDILDRRVYMVAMSSHEEATTSRLTYFDALKLHYEAYSAKSSWKGKTSILLLLRREELLQHDELVFAILGSWLFPTGRKADGRLEPLGVFGKQVEIASSSANPFGIWEPPPIILDGCQGYK